MIIHRIRFEVKIEMLYTGLINDIEKFYLLKCDNKIPSNSFQFDEFQNETI